MFRFRVKITRVWAKNYVGFQLRHKTPGPREIPPPPPIHFLQASTRGFHSNRLVLNLCYFQDLICLAINKLWIFVIQMKQIHSKYWTALHISEFNAYRNQLSINDLNYFSDFINILVMRQN